MALAAPERQGVRASRTVRAPFSLRASRILPLPCTHREQLMYVLRSAIVVGLYVASANAGLSLSVAHGSATPVWAPTGISLAALLIFGPSVWPAIAAGAFITNATTPIPIGAAAGIACGNTAEALVGYLLLRSAGFPRSLERVRDVIALVATPGGCIGSSAISWTTSALNAACSAPSVRPPT